MKKKSNFSPEFRLEAAQLLVDQGYMMQAACDVIEVGMSSLNYWVR